MVRLEKGLTQGELGDILGLNRTTVTNIEKGLNGPTLKTLIILDHQLGVSMRWLLTGKTGMEKIPESKEFNTGVLINTPITSSKRIGKMDLNVGLF